MRYELGSYNSALGSYNSPRCWGHPRVPSETTALPTQTATQNKDRAAAPAMDNALNQALLMNSVVTPGARPAVFSDESKI